MNDQKFSLKKINKKLIILNVVLIALFFASQIIVTSILGIKSQEIDFIRREKENLRLQNEILNSDIDKSNSLSSSEEIKDKYDLTEKNVTFLNEDNFEDLALR